LKQIGIKWVMYLIDNLRS